ncbi:MAG: phosphoenolpyruvate carboxykinase (ATP) [Chitinophagaceae bacterium]|nr:MAG: phosphoenolpyruvate carboxykinase (ATP) [Chitinophagaceae bacterium]
MTNPVLAMPVASLKGSGFTHPERIRYQLSPEELVEDTLRLNEGELNDTGALVIRTGEFTGRSPKDKFIVKDAVTESMVDWNEFNNPITEASFNVIHSRIVEYLNGLPELWVRDAHACADPRFRLHLRVVNEKPWNNLFAYNMFLRPAEEDLEEFEPEWTILSAPGLRLDPVTCGTRQHNATVVSFTRKMILIAGSGYTGETKKSIFTILNYLLPVQHKVLSMHCSANAGKNGDTAIFFGLSGTGKTTLSADPARDLIGDDEHGWAGDTIFNFEGGCYAKTISLSEDKEPGIYQAIRFGALVENTVFTKGTNHIDFDDASITENTRVSYPLDYISNAVEPSVGSTPTNIFFLTCDAFGVLPPISKLTPGQAMYQFISGYTAKIAGTEAGITEPKPTFSACFGAPFIPLHPTVYATMLGEKMQTQKVNVWMINTGWTGGEYGTGKRMPLKYTRAMISAVLENKMAAVSFSTDPVFGLAVPDDCPGVPAHLLVPANTWSDRDAYKQKANYLAGLFNKNFERFRANASEETIAAAPRTGM